MTTIYFVRHAEPNYKNYNDAQRELTHKGLEDRKLVSEYLADKNIDVVISSPFRRAIDTVKHFADKNNFPIEIIEDFRERKIDTQWIENFGELCKRQWEDFSYKLPGGETLAQVQQRNIKALGEVLLKYKDKTIVIGSHGTALSTIINYFDNTFGYNDFLEIKPVMPLIVKFVFDEDKIHSIEKINVFSQR